MADETVYGLCPSWAISLGYMGVAAGAVLSNWGSAVSSGSRGTRISCSRLIWGSTTNDDGRCMNLMQVGEGVCRGLVDCMFGRSMYSFLFEFC